jgi:hypothetical protein
MVGAVDMSVIVVMVIIFEWFPKLSPSDSTSRGSSE